MSPLGLSLTTKFSCFFTRFFSNQSRFGRICLVNAVIQNWLILWQFFSLTFLKMFHLSQLLFMFHDIIYYGASQFTWFCIIIRKGMQSLTMITATWTTFQQDVSVSCFLLLTLSISSLFLFRAECVILTVTAPSCPCRRRAIRLGCSGLNEISSSGLGNRLVLPCSWEISKESSTEGPPAELCWNYNFQMFFIL